MHAYTGRSFRLISSKYSAYGQRKLEDQALRHALLQKHVVRSVHVRNMPSRVIATADCAEDTIVQLVDENAMVTT